MAFSGNTKIPQGTIIKPFSLGSSRVALQPFATRFPKSLGQHLADRTNNFHNGTLIHVSGSGSTSAAVAAASIHVADLNALDEVYLWASNTGETAAQITVSFVSGGYMINGNAPSDADVDYALNAPWRVVSTVSAKSGMELVYPGIPHTNNDALFAVSSNSEIYVSGFVMRKYRVSKTDINQGYDGTD